MRGAPASLRDFLRARAATPTDPAFAPPDPYSSTGIRTRNASSPSASSSRYAPASSLTRAPGTDRAPRHLLIPHVVFGARAAQLCVVDFADGFCPRTPTHRPNAHSHPRTDPFDFLLLLSQTVALVTTSLLVAAWTLLRKPRRALARLPPCARVATRRDFRSRRDDRRRLTDDERTPRDAPVHLVIDTVVLVLATMRALVVSGGAAFADPAWAAATTAGGPLAMASDSRISTETDAFADVAAAVGRKVDGVAALDARASTGRRAVPSAGRGSRGARVVHGVVVDGRRARHGGERLGSIFQTRATAVQPHGLDAVALGVAGGRLGRDAARRRRASARGVLRAGSDAIGGAAVALAASHGCSSEENVRQGRETSRHGDQDPRSTITRQVSAAGMTTRLTQSLYTLNVFNASLAAVLFLFFGSNGNVPVRRRRHRGVDETDATVARVRVPRGGALAGWTARDFRTRPRRRRSICRICRARWRRLDAAGRRMDELIAGFGAGGGPRPSRNRAREGAGERAE